MKSWYGRPSTLKQTGPGRAGTGNKNAATRAAALEAQGVRLSGDQASLIGAVFTSPTGNARQSQPRASSIPVVGLAECGLKDWYRREEMAVAASAPPDLADPDAFAVIAVGISMVPEGVLAGHLCICSPAATPAPGDLVYLEERNGNASLKIFDGADAEWIEFRSYLPPDEAGSQAPYIDKKTRASLARVATVVYVKRRL